LSFRRLLALLLVILASGPAAAQVWNYSAPGCEIFDVRFSPDGRKVAFVRRYYSRERHAEGLRSRILENPRCVDPEVMIADLGQPSTDDHLCKLDWGWEPAFSPDGDRVVYSRQVSPIGAQRLEAATLKGNEIVLRDLSCEEGVVVAKPSAGAYCEPLISRDGGFVYFTISDAVDGTWPAGVGIGLADLGTGLVGTLLPRRRKFGQYHLQGPRWQVGHDVLCVRLTPRRDGAYRAELLNLSAGSRRLYLWPRVADLSGVVVGIGADGFAYVKTAKWLRVDRRTGKTRTVQKPPFLDRAGGSPNGRLRVLTSERAFRVLDRKGRTVLHRRLAGEILEVDWMPNSRGLAVVSTQRMEGRFDRDLLEIYRLGGPGGADWIRSMVARPPM